MSLGLSTNIGSSQPLKEVLEYASAMKMKHLEVKLDKAGLVERLDESKSTERLRDVLRSYDLTYTLHAPYIDVNLASLNPYIGKASEKAVERSIRLAYKLNSAVVTIHPGRLSRDYPQTLLSKAIENAVERIGYLKSLGDELGICVSVENDHKTSNRMIAGYPDQVRSLISRIRCKFTFDVGHANTLVDPVNFVELLSKDIALVHLHDNKGGSDSHLGVGDGNIDFKKVISSLLGHGYRGPLILEVYKPRKIDSSIKVLSSILNK